MRFGKDLKKIMASLASVTLLAAASPASPDPDPERPTIVLVHGAFVDGSGWAGVYRVLNAEGYTVLVVQNPTTSLADDVAATRRVIARADGKVVLVGHSYGGAVITEAGTDPKVAALVYVAAFAPDRGESVSSILASAPAGAPPLPLLPPDGGFLTLDRARFAAIFAPDVAPDVARFMADSQQPWSVSALEGKVTAPAWKDKPTWFVVSKDDQVIPPDLQRGMARRARATVREVAGSHAVYVSDPRSVAGVIIEAAVRAEEAGRN